MTRFPIVIATLLLLAGSAGAQPKIDDRRPDENYYKIQMPGWSISYLGSDGRVITRNGLGFSIEGRGAQAQTAAAQAEKLLAPYYRAANEEYASRGMNTPTLSEMGFLPPPTEVTVIRWAPSHEWFYGNWYGRPYYYVNDGGIWVRYSTLPRRYVVYP